MGIGALAIHLLPHTRFWGSDLYCTKGPKWLTVRRSELGTLTYSIKCGARGPDKPGIVPVGPPVGSSPHVVPSPRGEITSPRGQGLDRATLKSK